MFFIFGLLIGEIEVKIKEKDFKENVVLIDFEDNLEKDIYNIDDYKIKYDREIILKATSIDHAIVKYKNGIIKKALVLFKNEDRLVLLIEGRTYFLDKNNKIKI